MIVTPLPARGLTAIRDALRSHGLEGDVCRDVAMGAESSAYHVVGVDQPTIEAMLSVAARLGLELITGSDWVVIAGANSRLGAFARPWVQPEPVRELAIAIGMAIPFERPSAWRHSTGRLSLADPVMMGVLNVTPNSFSDGGLHDGLDAALRHADSMIEAGAGVIDIGGESTRPGAEPVGDAVELERILPVVAAIHRRHPTIPISVDTVRGGTARAALDAGASIINDVSGGRHDPGLLAAAAERGAGLLLTHSRGEPGDLSSYDHADYDGDVTGTVLREVGVMVANATAAGVTSEAIAIDPGFGFGKVPEQNFRLLDDLDAFARLGFPVVAAVSRKRFLGIATDRPVEDRDRATAAACALAVDRGASILRVHDPEAMRDAIAVANAIRRSRA